jgi:mercuric ion binding protein
VFAFIFRYLRGLDEFAYGNGAGSSFFYYPDLGLYGIRVSQTLPEAFLLRRRCRLHYILYSTQTTPSVLAWLFVNFDAADFSLVSTLFFVLRENNMTIKSSLLILSLSSSILWIPLAYAEATTAQPIRQQTVTLNIENMTCAMCTVTIKKALQKVDGVQQVTVDYDSKTAVVTFDTLKTDSEALIKATTDAGYPGTLATPVSR